MKQKGCFDIYIRFYPETDHEKEYLYTNPSIEKEGYTLQEAIARVRVLDTMNILTSTGDTLCEFFFMDRYYKPVEVSVYNQQQALVEQAYEEKIQYDLEHLLEKYNDLEEKPIALGEDEYSDDHPF